MQLVKSFALASAVTLALTAPAYAQQPVTRPQQSSFKGYLIGGAGASVADTTAAMLSAEIAERVHGNLQVYVNFTYYDNLMSGDTRDQLDQVGAALSTATGAPWSFQGRDRGRSFTVGTKYVLPSSGVKPYIGAGIGAINLRRTIREQSHGDVTAAYLSQFGGADDAVDITQTNTTKPMGELAAGIGVVAGRTFVDFGYRFRKAFHAGSNGFDFSSFGVAAGVKF